MKTITKARSCSALDQYDEDEPRVSRQTRVSESFTPHLHLQVLS